MEIIRDPVWFEETSNYGGGPDFSKSLGYYKLTQFTGLKDKNGKEIYEGDVVLEINPVGLENRVTAVSWNYEHAGFNPFWVDYESSNNSRGKDWKVIGNIYENPGLLK